DHLELEARRLADRRADVLERLVVVGGHLDDDVLVARREPRLLEAQAVDAAVNRLLGLRDRLAADVALDLALDAERDLRAVGGALELELGEELLEERVVDLLRV